MFAEFLSADAVPFARIAPWAIAFVFACSFLGFFIRGAFGFGSNMPIVLLTTWVLGPHHAILLVLLATFAAQIHLLPQGLRTADWAVTRPLIVGILVGISAGTWLFTVLAADWLTLVMGCLITAVVLMDRFRLIERLATRVDLRAPRVNGSLAAVSSAIGALSGGGAMYCLVLYLKLACRTAAALRGTNLVLSAVFSTGRVILVSIAGLISPQLLVETVVLLPVVLLGTWSGTRFFHNASPERFYAALQALLLLAALALTTKGLLRLI